MVTCTSCGKKLNRWKKTTAGYYAIFMGIVALPIAGPDLFFTPLVFGLALYWIITGRSENFICDKCQSSIAKEKTQEQP